MNQCRVSESIASFLVEKGVRHVFMLAGGGAMFLNDAIAFHPKIKTIFCHHEQACAMAAEGYARINGNVGVVNVTTGPGGINALNGVFGAWTDSIALLVISGQVKRETCLAFNPVHGLRQLGDQEAEIIKMVKPITKYAAEVGSPGNIRLELEKAYAIAKSGRPGPVWLDIPIDVQSSFIDPSTLIGFDREAEECKPDPSEIEREVRFVLDRLRAAKRPVLMVGSGIRVGNALPEFEAAIRVLRIPVVTAWSHDLLASDDPLFCGRPGTIGTRAGNFVVQNADTLLIVGSRLNIRQTSYNYAGFAPRAFKMQVDIDPIELCKPTVKIDHGIHADAKTFFQKLAALAWKHGFSATAHKKWLAWCKSIQVKYPQVLPKHREWRGKINPYHFIEVLFDQLSENDIVVTGNATACITAFQAAKLKRGQRLFSNSGSASMGYDLPAAIGAAFAAPITSRIICLAGDGSLQLNIQELQTIAHHQLPVKIFVLNNNGYLSIRTSQGNFFKRLAGEGPESGVSFPDYCKVARAYGIDAMRLDSSEFAQNISNVLNKSGPMLCEVMLDDTQQFEPRMSSRQLEDGRIVTPPLEDMFPFLSREEIAENILAD
ncbi:MAG: thiamine pyrophosphate-binding protein [Pseudomonadota bacterium]